MKILLVSALPLPMGGVAAWTEKYKKSCEQLGVSLSIVNTAMLGRRGQRVNCKRNIIDEIKRTSKILHNMRQEIKRELPSIVHINTSCSKFGVFRDLLCMRVALRRRLPIVLHCHCNVEDQLEGNLAQKAFHWMVNKANVVLTLNQLSYEYVKDMTQREVRILPNFVESSVISQNYDIKDEIKEVLFVGHVQTKKGCKEILRVAERLPYIHFTLVGQVSHKIEAMHCPDNVSLIGEVPHSEVQKYMQQADVYLFPSYTEGFSISLVEAMANGLPVIATDVGATKDMIDGDGGIMIPIRDVEAIIQAIQTLQDKDVRNKMSQWNVEKVKTCYTQERVIEQLFSYYREVLS